MQLQHIPLDQLKPSSLNVRKTGGTDVGDLTASIRSLGLLQPLLVRRNCEGFDIIAGQRRFHALRALAEEAQAEQAGAEPVPCLVMEEEDARAIEASLAENLARLPMDELDQYRAFAALKDQGLGVSDIAARFGVTERLVEQRLAIAGLIPAILNAYRKGDIRPETLRILTMATPRQQKAWWKLFRSEGEYAPTGRTLKDWLFGGSHIPVSNALFDLAAYDGVIVSDLFGEERYFADSGAFWRLQLEQVEAMRARLLEAGWDGVEVLDIGCHFAPWNHVKRPRTKGGRVYITLTRDGEVTTHEGYLPHKEAERRDRAGDSEDEDEAACAKPARSELTASMRNYLALHRHAAVRTELLAHPGLALRLALAHMMAGSSLWRVEAEPQRAAGEAIAASLEASKAQASFAAERTAILALLGWEDTGFIAGARGAFHRPDLGTLFETLCGLPDSDILRILAYVMAETLAVDSSMVDALGERLGTDMRAWWNMDATFLDVMRDKTALNAMVGELAGQNTADAHRASTGKVHKKIIADCLSGERKAATENWLPRYMTFPAGRYCA